MTLVKAIVEADVSSFLSQRILYLIMIFVSYWRKKTSSNLRLIAKARKPTLIRNYVHLE